jgi:site-specific recombinase XerD
MAKIQVLEEFISSQKSFDKSESTLRSYKSDIVSFASWFKKTNSELLRLRKITPTDMRQYKQYLIASEYKPNTINRHLLKYEDFSRMGLAS